MVVDAYKLTHWMNARKLTPDAVAQRSGIEAGRLVALMERPDGSALSEQDAARLAEALAVAPPQIASRPGVEPVIVATAAEVEATRRPITRDGIHFYNYYSLPAPLGREAPVILDILCPAGRVPGLNNGHLEPAITVNLGPGHIRGRWAEEAGPGSDAVLEANASPATSWIVGETYVEPSYCPHTYALVDGTPARILSFTVPSTLYPLVDQLNGWADPQFERLLAVVEAGAPPACRLLAAELARRGFTAATAAAAGGVEAARVEAFVAGDEDALGLGDLRRLGTALGFDPRVFMAPARRHDEVGKTVCSVAESEASIRRFASYTVASMASAPHAPDLAGAFVRVEGRPGGLDLCDPQDDQYLVTAGAPAITWRTAAGGTASRELGEGDALWVAPFVEHRFDGDGALIKLGSGSGAGYRDQLELTSTFAPERTLRRARRDRSGWGYDGSGS